MGEFTKGPVEADRVTFHDLGDKSGWYVFSAADTEGIICEMQGAPDTAGNARLIAAAFNAATAVEALGYDGQEAIEKLPEMVEALAKCHAAFDAICMAGHMHLVSGAMLDGFGMDTIRAALPTRLAESE